MSNGIVAARALNACPGEERMPSLMHTAQPRRTRATVVAAAALAILAGSPSLVLADYHEPPMPAVPLVRPPAPDAARRAQEAALRCDVPSVEAELKTVELDAAFREGAARGGYLNRTQAQAALADAASLDMFAANLRAWVRAACPRRVGDQTFYQSGNADKARPLYAKAEAAARDCNRQAYLDAIKELCDLADAIDKEANALIGIPGIDVARGRRASELQRDAKSARDLAGRLEREYNQRFSHCPPEGTTTPPVAAPGTTGPQQPGPGTPSRGTQPARPGTQPPGSGTQTPGTPTPPGTQPVTPPPPFVPQDPRRADGEIFNDPERARRARNLLGKAADAARNCDRKAYRDAAFELHLDGVGASYRAADARAAGTPAAQQRAREISQDGDALTRLAKQLNAQFDALFKNCPEPPGFRIPPGGAPFFGAVTPQRPNYALNVQAGGNVSWAPRVSGGTIIPQLGVAGTELPLVWGPRTLTGASFSMDAKIPLSITPLDREWTFMPRILYGYADGSASGMIAPGGVFTGRTYLLPNPATGTTGVFYGATGQAIDIESHTHQFGADLVVGTNVFSGQTSGWRYSLFAGGGFSYRFDWTGNTIDERNLSFDNIWSRTEFTNDDHFFGARLAAGAKLDNGRWHGSLTAHLTPGIVVSNASARQWNVCALCPPAEQSFMLEHQRTKTGFGVRTGLGATVDYDLTRSFRIGASVQFDYISRQSVWRNPVTPGKGPPHLGVSDAALIRFAIRGVFVF